MPTVDVKPAAKSKPKTVGALVDAAFALRAKKSELESAVKDLAGQLADLEAELLERMQAEGQEKVATKHGSASVSTSTVADVVDWDAFLSFIYRKKYGHLLQRRVSDPAWRELQEQGVKVPGTQPFHKKRIAFRAA